MFIPLHCPNPDCDYSTLRRGGRMTREQKVRRKELEKIFRPAPRSVEKSFRRLLDLIRKDRADGEIPFCFRRPLQG